MAPEHFMYLGLKIWKLLGNVMVDRYLANCLICNNCSALHLQAGIEYSKCEDFGLIKAVLRGAGPIMWDQTGMRHSNIVRYNGFY